MEASSQFIVPLTERWGVRDLVSTRDYVKLLSQCQAVNDMYLKPAAWDTFPQNRSYKWVTSISDRSITAACIKMENVWRNTIKDLSSRRVDGEIPELSQDDEDRFEERAKYEFNGFEFPPLADWSKFSKQMLKYCRSISARYELIIFGKDEPMITMGNLAGQFDMLCEQRLVDLKMGTPDPTTDILQLFHYATLIYNRCDLKMFDKQKGCFEERNRDITMIELFYPMYEARIIFPVNPLDLLKLKRFLSDGKVYNTRCQPKLVIVEDLPIVQPKHVSRISAEMNYREFINDPWVIQSSDEEFFKWYEGATLSDRKMNGKKERFRISGYKTKADALNAAKSTLGDYEREQYGSFITLCTRTAFTFPLEFDPIKHLTNDSRSEMDHNEYIDRYVNSYVRVVKHDYNANMKHVGEFDVLSYPRACISSIIQKLEELLGASLSPSIIVDGLVINWSSNPIPRRVKHTYFRIDPRVTDYTDEEFFKWYGGAKIISCKDRKRFPWIPNYIDISSFRTKAEAVIAISKL